MSRYVAKVIYKANVEVTFDTDSSKWRDIQSAAIEAAMDQELIPEDWVSIELPLVERAE